MKLTSLIVVLLAIWYIRAASLPKLYYRLKDRREVDIQHLRKVEKAGLKVTKLLLDLKYFDTCVELGVCPNYLKFKPPKLPAYRDTKSVYRQVLSNQIKYSLKDLKSTKAHYSAQLKLVCSRISTLEKIVLCHLLRKQYESLSHPILQTHNKKLMCLWKTERNRSPDCLLNLSKVKLSILEENALRFGLKNHILPKKVNEILLKVDIEKLVSSITYDNNVILNVDFRDKLKSMVKSYVSQCNGLCSNKQNQSLHNTLRALGMNKLIKVCKYDKGNGVVVLNCIDYFDKLDIIILDQSKFEEIKWTEKEVHPIIVNENKIKGYLYRSVQGKVDDTIYKNITPSGSQPGKAYGLCKVHKVGNPMRPVISMLNTAEFKLAKYLDSFIKPNINSSYSVNSTSSFVDKLNDFKFGESDTLVSFDVC